MERWLRCFNTLAGKLILNRMCMCSWIPRRTSIERVKLNWTISTGESVA